MYEVTCFHCGHVARISPDVERCAVCGADLKHLITPDYASRYFYDRAAEMAAAGELTLARLEVERGLAYSPTSELHLLAAILSQRLGDYNEMRRHVSAIGVDDVLRPEAEWLLRSQQLSPRGGRPATLPAPPSPTVEPRPPGWADAATERRVMPSPAAVRTNPLLYGAVAVILILTVAWFALDPVADAILALFPAADQDVAQATPTPATTPTTAQATPSGLAAPATLTTTLLPSPTPQIPDDLVQPANPQEPLAAVTPLDLSGSTAFDFNSYLAQTNRPELAELEVAALLEGDRLKLQGIVQLFDQRASLIDLAGRAPGVATVDAVDLLVRLPPTYTVQAGDSLWLISYKLYGVDRVAELYNANRNTLSTPESLRVGQTLNVPQ